MTTADESEIPGHKVIRTLASGPNGAVLLAARAVGGWQVVVKTFRPALLIDDTAEQTDHRNRVTAFVETARMQQELAGRAKRWAPVHDFGRLPDGGPGTGDGAFYTTDSYPAALDWLIRGHVTITGSTLHAIVSQVVAALMEIRTCCNRGHGNLTPANVLLKRREMRSIRVLLTDASSDAGGDAAAADESDDRWALGAMIYSLVTHQPMRRMTLLPVDPGGEWTALGRNSARWLSLCNRLLSRDRTERPDLPAVLLELRRLRGVNRQKVVRRGGLAAAAAVVAGLVWAGKYASNYRQACGRTAAAERQWVRSLIKAAGPEGLRADPDLKSAVLADQSLGQPFLDELASVDAAGKLADDRSWVPTSAKYATVTRAPGTIADLAAKLRPDHWQTLQNLRAFRTEAESPDHQWKRVTAQLDKLTSDLPPNGGDDAGPRFRAVMTDGPLDLGSKRSHVEAQWKKLVSDEDDLRGADQYGRYEKLRQALHARACSVVNLDDEDSPNSLLGKVDFACVEMKSYIGNEGGESEDSFGPFKTSVTEALGPDAPPELTGSLDSLKGLVRLDPRTVPEWGALGKAKMRVKAQLDTLGSNASEEPLRRRYVEIAKSVDDIAKEDKKDDDRSKFAEVCRELSGRLDAISADAAIATQNAGLVQTLRDATPALAAAYPQWAPAVDSLVGDLATDADKPAVFQAEAVHAADWPAALSKLQQQLEAVADAAKYPKSVQTRWAGQMLAAAVPAIDLRTEPGDPKSLVDAGTECPWSVELHRFAAAFPVKASSRLDLAAWRKAGNAWMGPAAPQADRDFWTHEPSLRDIDGVKSDAAYIDAIATADKANRDALPALAFPKNLDTATADTSLAARVRLDSLKGADAWPRSADELKASADWFKQAVGPGDPLRLGGDLPRIRVMQRAAWCRVVASANGPDELAKAIALGAGCGIPDAPAALAALDEANTAPVVLHNTLIFFANQAAQPGVTHDRLYLVTAGLDGKEAARVNEIIQGMGDADIKQAISNPSWYHWNGAGFSPVKSETAVAVHAVVNPVADPDAEVQAILKRAATGDGNANKKLGKMYRNGEHVPQDDDAAIACYKRVTQRYDDEDSELALAQLLDLKKHDTDAAAKWYKILDKRHNNVEAAGWLADHNMTAGN